ncbi:translation initiation factor IF-3, partial [Mycolicibacterium mageritense]|uniref:translation initiation factor IF-3 n=1 Tax=Mycolicibacterium mageritense TaxID=53462 RepID=UPI003C6E4BAE
MGPAVSRAFLLIGVGSLRQTNIGGPISTETRVNERIRVPEVRLIGPGGEQVGIVRIEDALRVAADADLDLVEVAPNARPPVCKIMDYGKYKYELSQKIRKNRQASKSTEMKELRLGRSVKIDKHDIQVR